MSPCTSLTLNIEMEPDRHSVPNSIIRAHLERFLSISVLKGSKSEGDASYSAMMDDLSNRPSVALGGTREYYETLKGRIYALAQRHDADEHLRHRLLGELIGSIP